MPPEARRAVGASAVPAVRFAMPPSGGFGHQSPGTTTGAGSVPWAGTGEGG